VPHICSGFVERCERIPPARASAHARDRNHESLSFVARPSASTWHRSVLSAVTLPGDKTGAEDDG
jgi:hypothetical protein